HRKTSAALELDRVEAVRQLLLLHQQTRVRSELHLRVVGENELAWRTANDIEVPPLHVRIANPAAEKQRADPEDKKRQEHYPESPDPRLATLARESRASCETIPAFQQRHGHRIAFPLRRHVPRGHDESGVVAECLVVAQPA